jgi:23S rRNA pseudouridine2457 synthase
MKKGPQLTYVIFNKPYGVLCQYTDDLGRPTLKKYIPIKQIYPVGRLDMDSEGLLLLTNDGDLNHWLASPKNRMYKTYLAQVEGIPAPEQLNHLKKGVVIQGRRTLPAKAKQIDEPKIWERPKPIRFRKNIPTSWIELSIMEGQNHQIKKMTAAVGLPCLRLIRVSLGPILLGNLAPGQYKIVPKPRV